MKGSSSLNEKKLLTGRCEAHCTCNHVQEDGILQNWMVVVSVFVLCFQERWKKYLASDTL